MIGKISGLFQENRIGQPPKLKHLQTFYDGAPLLILKSRLKMKPINTSFDHGFPPKILKIRK
jgi:hypothetical protein